MHLHSAHNLLITEGFEEESVVSPEAIVVWQEAAARSHWPVSEAAKSLPAQSLDPEPSQASPQEQALEA